jgi:hypothetical protein
VNHKLWKEKKTCVAVCEEVQEKEDFWNGNRNRKRTWREEQEETEGEGKRKNEAFFYFHSSSIFFTF